jgi:Derlin-2/3
MRHHAHLAFFLFSAIALNRLQAVAGRIPRAPTTSLARRASFLRSERRRSHGIQGGSSSLTPSFQSSRRVVLIRGGAFDDDSDGDDGGESDFSDFDFDDGDGMFDFDAVAEDDFGDEGTVTQIIEAYRKTPPLTKAYLTASFGAALLGYVANGNDFPSILQLEWKPILTRMQVWRPLTAFLNFGPLGLGYLMTAHFVWTYMSTLERLNHGKPYDFWLMMFFGSASMVVGYSMMGLSPRFLGHNLSTFLVYVWSRYHEGLEVSMFELFNTRAELLPWFFLAQVSRFSFFFHSISDDFCTCWIIWLNVITCHVLRYSMYQTFLLEGEVPVLDFLGIVFGHIYHHYKTTNVLRTPKFVIQWYNGDNKYARMLREKYKAISSDFEMV